MRLRHLLTSWLLILNLSLLAACGDSSQASLRTLSEEAVILAFGDSLTYGTGAEHQTESYPAILAELSGRTVINAGVPGEVSREGLARIETLLTQHQPELVLLCHGGNDLLRKLSEVELKQNLTQMIQLIRQQGAEVVMLSVPKPGLFLKPSPIYREVAQSLQVPLEDNIIVEIESENTLKSDPIHPNASGYRLLAERIHQLLSQSGAL
ncbi:arylesterase [Methylophaga sp. OBS1]|jgi:lysophospholipase L1-like esterase|uniref:arylesterase n=1 Tax=Methylophaga sp. OBS1 TaxID=2991933 RepID=UPI002253531C|nr:arylesterase [Methylophaga sp. OBS1]MCX4191292.1 arylesterase [Methylophaga sp. OBS1]MCX4191762.1 arylesterase [Methylophaga sp. OBS1]